MTDGRNPEYPHKIWGITSRLENEGSCRLFALARVKGLSAEDTVQLFGRFYRDDVLKHPDGSDHANIRRFMKDGWAGIVFDGTALVPKED